MVVSTSIIYCALDSDRLKNVRSISLPSTQQTALRVNDHNFLEIYIEVHISMFEAVEYPYAAFIIYERVSLPYQKSRGDNTSENLCLVVPYYEIESYL